MCAEPAASNPFMLYLHRTKLTDLVPGQEYLYQVAGAPAAQSFTAAPEPGPDSAFTFVAFGDMGDALHAEAKSPG